MYKCWNCGTEHESTASSDADSRDPKAEYAKGYLDGYTDAEQHYTNRCIVCGTGGIASPPLCIPCKKENPHWMGG